MKPMEVQTHQPLSVRHLRSGWISSVDALRSENASALLQIAGVIGFALLTVLGAHVRIYIWEVPITLQTLAVYGSGLFLGWRNGFLAQALYLSLGLFMPVFAGDGYGVAYLSGSVTAGYLLAYPLVALLIGSVSRRWNTLAGSTLCMIAGSILLFSVGVTWLHFAAGHETWMRSIQSGWLNFIPIDLAKIMLVGVVYAGSRTLGKR
jgi:biotin transport system substrate-specific component